MSELSEEEKCATDISRKLGASEQVICYHLRELEKLGFIKLERTVKRRGAIAKYYKAEHQALAVIPGSKLGQNDAARPFSGLRDVARKVVDPYIGSGKFGGSIIVGSPDAHGIFRARARDGHRAADVAMFLGSLLPLSRELMVRLDTEVTQEELSKSLILIGGPRVNTVTFTVNQWLPVTYELTGNTMMMSRISSRSYTGEEEGTVQMVVNPNNPEKWVVVIAGNTSLGTQAAVIAFLKYTEDIAAGNMYNRNIVARVVTGVDLNSDGMIDDVEFLE